jgi:hypothetical protein
MHYSYYTKDEEKKLASRTSYEDVYNVQATKIQRFNTTMHRLQQVLYSMYDPSSNEYTCKLLIHRDEVQHIENQHTLHRRRIALHQVLYSANLGFPYYLFKIRKLLLIKQLKIFHLVGKLVDFCTRNVVPKPDTRYSDNPTVSGFYFLRTE